MVYYDNTFSTELFTACGFLFLFTEKGFEYKFLFHEINKRTVNYSKLKTKNQFNTLLPCLKKLYTCMSGILYTDNKQQQGI